MDYAPGLTLPSMSNPSYGYDMDYCEHNNLDDGLKRQVNSSLVDGRSMLTRKLANFQRADSLNPQTTSTYNNMSDDKV